MILTDTRLLTNLKILSESKESNTMKIRGIFQRADEKNNNKRIYPKALMEEHVKSMQEAIKENRLLGELDHPAYDVVKLSNASHKITKLEMQGNDVIGEAIVLSTPAGMVAQALIRDGVAIGISSRGTGSLAEGKDGTSIVKEYHGITYDLVADPSTRGAFPSLTESKVGDQREYILGVMNKVFGEKVLVRMIENSLKSLTTEPKKEKFDYAAKIEEIAQSLKTIKLARAKRVALAKKGFGDKTSTLQKAKNDANPEYQSKMQSKRAPMLKAALDKRKDIKVGSMGESKQTKEKTYKLMEIFKNFGFKNRFHIAVAAKQNPNLPPKKHAKAQKVLDKLFDRHKKNGFRTKHKDDAMTIA